MSPDADQLAAWLAAIAAGDRVAFKAFYDATSPRLFGMAMHVLRRRELAEDALQETYLRIWSQAGRYDPARGTPWPWLACILRNIALTRLRGERKDHEDIDIHADRLAAPPVIVTEWLDLLRGLRDLAPGPRRALALAIVLGCTQEEVAARLEAPLGTAKSWLRRGAERLRLQMGS